jgi:hypothetical protein
MSIDGVTRTNHDYDRHMAEQAATSEAVKSPSDEISDPPSSADDPGTSLLLLDGDLSAQVAALTILSAQKQRETNRDIQIAEEAALERAENQQVQALHEKAADIRLAGLIDGAAGMTSGVFTMAASFDAVDQRDLYQGAAKISDATGKGLGGCIRGNQADHEANATTHEHEAGHHRRNLDAARDGIREGQDLLERALDFYKQSQQSLGDATSSSVRRG